MNEIILIIVYITSNISKYYSLQFLFQIHIHSGNEHDVTDFSKYNSCYLMSKKATVWCFIEKNFKRDVRDHTVKIVNALIIVLVPVKKNCSYFFVDLYTSPWILSEKRLFNQLNLAMNFCSCDTKIFFCRKHSKTFYFHLLCTSWKFYARKSNSHLEGDKKFFPLPWQIILWF